MLDDLMPAFDVSERHAIRVAAPPGVVWEALHRVDLFGSSVVRLLLTLRALPRRLSGRGSGTPSRSTITDLPRAGFVLLAEEAGERVVFGLAGPVWRLRFEPLHFAAHDFVALALPGTVKVAFGLRVREVGQGTSILETETRVAAADARSRTRFRTYWRLVGPVSGVTRRAMLRNVAAEATRART